MGVFSRKRFDGGWLNWGGGAQQKTFAMKESRGLSNHKCLLLGARAFPGGGKSGFASLRGLGRALCWLHFLARGKATDAISKNDGGKGRYARTLRCPIGGARHRKKSKNGWVLEPLHASVPPSHPIPQNSLISTLSTISALRFPPFSSVLPLAQFSSQDPLFIQRDSRGPKARGLVARGGDHSGAGAGKQKSLRGGVWQGGRRKISGGTPTQKDLFRKKGIIGGKRGRGRPPHGRSGPGGFWALAGFGGKNPVFGKG